MIGLIAGLMLTGVVDRVVDGHAVVEWRRRPCEVLGWTQHELPHPREGVRVRARLGPQPTPLRRRAALRAFLDTGRAAKLRLEPLRGLPARVNPRRCRVASNPKESRHE